LGGRIRQGVHHQAMTTGELFCPPSFAGTSSRWLSAHGWQARRLSFTSPRRDGALYLRYPFCPADSSLSHSSTFPPARGWISEPDQHLLLGRISQYRLHGELILGPVQPERRLPGIGAALRGGKRRPIRERRSWHSRQKRGNPPSQVGCTDSQAIISDTPFGPEARARAGGANEPDRDP
jgi:hypothetical protein